MANRDPELRTQTTLRERNNTPWIIGAVALLLLLGVLAFTWDRTPTNTASNPNASAPASTTGSAAPARPDPTPAPAQPAAPAR